MGRKATNPQNLKPFKKGDPRINREGRPKKIPALDALLENIPEEDYKSMLEKLMSKAKAGDVRAAEVLLDRAYGKAKQTMEFEITDPIKTYKIVPASERTGDSSK